MKLASTFVIAVALVAGVAGAAPAAAKTKDAPAAQPQSKFKLDKDEQKAIVPLQDAVNKKDFTAAAAALPAAQAAAKSPDALLLVGNFQLQMAIAANDENAEAAALDMMIRSGSSNVQNLPQLYQALAELHIKAKRYPQAEQTLQKLVTIDPNNTNTVLMLAELDASQNKKREAIGLIDQAIAKTKAAGQPVPENWYKRNLKFAYEEKLDAKSAQISRDLIAAYPTPTNWRDALIIYRTTNTLDRGAEIDLLRLMRAANAMKGESDYFTLANDLNLAGLPGESKAVIDEGGRLKAIDTNKDLFRSILTSANGRVSSDRASLPGLETRAHSAPTGKLALSTGEAYFGYGDYAKAIDLYRLAAEKGGVDSNVVNTRLGIALAMTGRKPEAEAAFKSVTGPRSGIASYWLLWLSQRA